MSDDDTFRWGDEDYEFAEEFFMPDPPSEADYMIEHWEWVVAKRAEEQAKKSEAESKDQPKE